MGPKVTCSSKLVCQDADVLRSPTEDVTDEQDGRLGNLFRLREVGVKSCDGAFLRWYKEYLSKGTDSQFLCKAVTLMFAASCDGNRQTCSEHSSQGVTVDLHTWQLLPSRHRSIGIKTPLSWKEAIFSLCRSSIIQILNRYALS